MKLISITGCIAAGKSTIAGRVSEIKGCPIISEEASKNPYLGVYYKDMKAYAFLMQQWYLENRLRQLTLHKYRAYTVQDQILEAFCFIFPKMQLKSGNLCNSDFIKLNSRYRKFVGSLRINEIVVYMRVDEKDIDIVYERVQQRCRLCELKIEREYLVDLVHAYDEWFEGKDPIVVDATQPIGDIVNTIIQKL